MTKQLLITWFILFSLNVKAQTWLPEIITSHGSIFKHTDKINFPTDVWSPALEIRISRQPGLRPSSWEQKHPGSYFGVNFTYRYLGDKRLGHAFGFFPSITTSLWRSKEMSLWFEVGGGISYLTEPFDLGKSEYNNAIGSHVNNITSFRIFLDFPGAKNTECLTGLGFSHYSNGALTLPNLGINVYSLCLGLRLGQMSMADKKSQPILEEPKRWRAILGGRYTQVEWITPGGPKYPVYSYHIGAKYIANERAHWLIGLEYEMNRAAYWWGLDNFVFADRREARNKSYRLMAFAGREIVFDRWSILLQLNINLRNNPIGTPKPYAQILGVKHYFAPHARINPYLGIFMKAHGTVAEYFSLGMGADLL